MRDRFFLDTNVFVYSLDAGEPVKSRRAADLIGEAVESHRGVISHQVIQEFCNVALRKFATPMSVAQAEQYLDSVLYPLLGAQSSAALFGGALRIWSRYKLGWYDSLIVSAAIEGECSRLYTEDLQHGLQVEGLRIENPFA